MERMKRLLEEREDDDASEEEMFTRFEKEKKESLLVVSAGITTQIHFLPIYSFYIYTIIHIFWHNDNSTC